MKSNQVQNSQIAGLTMHAHNENGILTLKSTTSEQKPFPQIIEMSNENFHTDKQKKERELTEK